MNWIMIAIQIAVIAYVYVHILTSSEMIFGKAYYRATQLAQRRPWTERFLKPLILCAYCVAGQMALWTLILYGVFHIEAIRTGIDILFFLSLCIFLVKLLTLLPNE